MKLASIGQLYCPYPLDSLSRNKEFMLVSLLRYLGLLQTFLGNFDILKVNLHI